MITKKSIQEKIDKNRDPIQKVLDLLNEGYLTPREAKEVITMISEKNKYLIEQLPRNTCVLIGHNWSFKEGRKICLRCGLVVSLEWKEVQSLIDRLEKQLFDPFDSKKSDK